MSAISVLNAYVSWLCRRPNLWDGSQQHEQPLQVVFILDVPQDSRSIVGESADKEGAAKGHDLDLKASLSQQINLRHHCGVGRSPHQAKDSR